MKYNYTRQGRNAPELRGAATRTAWDKSSEKEALVKKLRTMPATTKVVVSGERGVVKSVNEVTLSVRVAIPGRPAVDYHVKVVEKAE